MNVNKDIVLSELEETREYLLSYVNSSIDALKVRIESGEPLSADNAPIVTTYPLSYNSALFKGTKPTAVYFGDEKVEVKTWRKTYTLILQRCAAIPKNHAMLMSLRNRVHGRDRSFLSDKPDGMNKPIEIADGLFAEGYFDTEWLVRVLTTEFLDVVGYDYSNISVSVIPAKRI